MMNTVERIKQEAQQMRDNVCASCSHDDEICTAYILGCKKHEYADMWETTQLASHCYGFNRETGEPL